MAFCGNCGTKMEDNQRFCPECGTDVTGAAPAQQAAEPVQTFEQPAVTPPVVEQAPVVEQPVTYQPAAPQPEAQAYTPPAAPVAYAAPAADAGVQPEVDPQDAQANKTMAVLAYIIFFIPLLSGAAKTSPFAKFHTNQGIILAIAAVAYSILNSILSSLLAFIPVIGWLLILLLGLLGFVVPVLCIMGIINAVNGRMKEIPVIGKFTILK